MTGAELRAIRDKLGLSASAWGRALGYSGPIANIAVHIRRFEREAREIPASVKRLAQMYELYGKSPKRTSKAGDALR